MKIKQSIGIIIFLSLVIIFYSYHYNNKIEKLNDKIEILKVSNDSLKNEIENNISIIEELELINTLNKAFYEINYNI